MKRKTVKKRHTPKKQSGYTISRFIIISLAALLALVVGNVAIRAAATIHVLGAATGPVYIADSQDTQDTQGQSGQDTNPGQTTPNPTTAPTDNQPSQENAQVDCIRPDGSHVVTDFHTCQEINQKQGLQTFQFTPLSRPTHQDTIEEQPIPQPTDGILQVQKEGAKGELQLETPNMHIHMKKEDNGTIKLTAITENGQKIPLQDSAISEINDALSEKDIHVGTGSANQLVIQSGNTQAETQLPVTLDPNTKTLAVTTPQGTKDLTVLPNQAVNSLLHQDILSHIASTTTTASMGAVLNATQLTEINNQPAYQIQGVLTRNLFGLFPIAFTKTVFVSAQNGQVLQIQQPIVDQLLQALSF